VIERSCAPTQRRVIGRQVPSKKWLKFGWCNLRLGRRARPSWRCRRCIGCLMGG
jgi:hypothetical protein